MVTKEKTGKATPLMSLKI